MVTITVLTAAALAAAGPPIRTGSRDHQHAETWRSAATSGHAVGNGRAGTRLRELITAKVEISRHPC